MLEKESIKLLTLLLEKIQEGYNLPDLPEIPEYELQKMEKVLTIAAEKMQDNYPYFHPLYAGQMLKPPHPVARLAYMMSLWINPNNHALDGGRASSAMEKEVVSDIASMIGWKSHMGHLTSGGTMANLEALWVAGKIHPGKIIVGSDQAHYTHSRITEVLKLDYEYVESTPSGKMDLLRLEEKLKKGNVGTVIVTMGTTGIGAVDPLSDILRLKEKYDFRIHIDGAYGGYFKLASNLKVKSEFDLIYQANSLVIDPHKHGLQPYGCGCIVFKDPDVYQYYRHDSPYTYYTSDEVHLGEISLECSRPGAAAVALWATHQLLPPVQRGKFAQSLEDCRSAAIDLYHRLENDERFLPLLEPELDIVVWAIKGSGTAEMSVLAQQFFDQAEKNQLYLSLFRYPSKKLRVKHSIIIDSDQLLCLRSCLIKPEHHEWMDELWKRIDLSMSQL